ncbi:MAG: AmmeMemoRadiSam system protein B [Candidatus Nitrospinota bacterium M3_3B_026]
MTTVRKPAVAGYFYPGMKSSIEAQMKAFDVSGVEKGPAYGLVVPHAGHKYSGPVAARVYASVEAAGTIVMLGPNHGAGAGFLEPPKAALMAEGEWELPTGDVPVDDGLAADLLAEAPLLSGAPWAHEAEHCLEVQLPFVQYFMGGVRIVPILLSGLTDAEALELGEGIARGIEHSGRDAMLLASTDFSHYVPHELARAQDMKAIEKIMALDAKGLLEVVRRERISMCGYLPTAVVMEACRRLGAKEAVLIDYQTSGETSGDYSSVVGYGGLVIR